MPISRRTIRRNTVRESRLSVYRTGTADAGGSTTQLLDAVLQSTKDNELAGANLYLLSGNDAFTDAMITGNSGSAGTVDFRPAFSAAPDTIEYEIAPFRLGQIYDAVDNAIDEMYNEKVVGLERDFLLVAGSPIFNPAFQLDTTGWTASGTPVSFSVEQQGDADATDSIRNSPVGAFNYLKFQGQASITTHVAPADWALMWAEQLRGHKVRLRAFVSTNTASEVRLNLVANGSNNYSSYHSASNTWELLETDEIDVSVTQALDFRIEHSGGGGDVYVALIWVETDAEVSLPLPSTDGTSLKEDDILDVQVSRDTLDTADDVSDIVQFPELRPTRWTQTDYDLDNDISTTSVVPHSYSTLWVPNKSGQRVYVKALMHPGTIDRSTSLSDTSRSVNLTPVQGQLIAKIACRQLLEELTLRVPDSLGNRIRERIGILSSQIARMLDNMERDISAALPWRK